MSSGDVLIWNVRTRQLVGKVMGCCGGLNKVTFTPDGTRLVGNRDRVVKFWDFNSFGRDGSGPEPHDSAETSTGMKELLDFKGHRVRPFCLLKRYSPLSSQSYVQFAAVSSDSRWVISCSSSEICVWKIDEAEQHCELLRPNDSGLPLCDFSPVCGYLAYGFCEDSQVRLWRFKQLLD
jgi:WD40 repeat protein